MQPRMQLKRFMVWPRRRIVGIIGAVLAFAAAIGTGGYFVGPALIPGKLVQTQLNEQIGRWTGGEYRLGDNTKIAVAPGFRVIVSDPAFVSVADETARPIMTADSIVAPLRIVPLLFGQIEIANLVLLHPGIDLRGQAGDFVENVNPQAQSATPAAQRRPPSAVTLINGTVRFDGATGVDEISGLDLRLANDVSSDAVAIQGGLIVGGRHLKVDLLLDDLAALVSDAGTRGSVNLRIGPRYDGEQDDVATSDGGMSYETTDILQQLSGVIGQSRYRFGSMAAEGTFSITLHSVDISDATFSLGGMEMNGHLRAEADDRQVISRLLGLPDLMSVAIVSATEMGAGHWVDTPVDMTWLNGLDLDVEMFGEDMAFGNSVLDAAAMSLVVGDGTATLDLAGTTEGLGDVAAELVLDYADSEGVVMAASGRVDDVSVDKLTQIFAAIGPPPLIGTAQFPEGTMNGAFDLNANGHTLGQLVDSLEGSATTRLTDGSLAGTDLVATLETLFRGREFMTEEDGPLIPAAGRTQFDQLDARIDFASGAANVSGVHIAGEGFGINMLGDVELVEGRMNVGGHAVLLSLPGMEVVAGDTLVDLPFGVGGTVFAPVVAAGVPTVTAQVDAYAED